MFTPRLPLSKAKLSYADDMDPGCREKGFSPPNPRGEYSRLGLGKKKGKGLDVGNVEEDEETGVDFDEDLLSDL